MLVILILCSSCKLNQEIESTDSASTDPDSNQQQPPPPETDPDPDPTPEPAPLLKGFKFHASYPSFMMIGLWILWVQLELVAFPQ